MSNFVSAFTGRTAGRDRLLCGVGADTVERVRFRNYVSPTCERAEPYETSGLQALVPGAIQFRLPMLSVNARTFALEELFCVDIACRATISLRLAHRLGNARKSALVGRQTFRVRANRHRRCLRGVRLSRLGRRLVRARTRARVRVALAGADAEGRRQAPFGFTTSLSSRSRRDADRATTAQERAPRCFSR